VKTEETEKAEANLTLIETDVPIGPPLATTREPSVDVDPHELVFTPGAWCFPIPLVLSSHTSVTHVPCPIDCHDEESIDITILRIRRDDDSSDDERASDDEESVELDTFPLYYDNEPIINQTTEKQKHQMGKEKKDKKTWTAMTYLATLMLTGITCTTAGIQWSLGTMKNSLVRVFFEPVWSALVLPLFLINTVLWYLARSLVESPDLQESSNKRKDISKRLRRKQTRAGQRRTTGLPVLFFFISTWGIMTGSVMLYKEFYQGQTPEHPFSLVNQQLAGTYQWMEALDRLVFISPGVLLQYQKVQAQQLWLEMRPKQVKSNECEKQE
jgi:hypothetical protein